MDFYIDGKKDMVLIFFYKGILLQNQNKLTTQVVVPESLETTEIENTTDAISINYSNSMWYFQS